MSSVLPQSSTRRQRLPRTVIALGLVSLLSDAAGDLITPLLPLYLTTVVGSGALALGWVEGTADLVSSLLKLVTGQWADKSRRYLPFVIAGYTLASIARPFTAAARVPWQVVLVRGLDRMGKGLRTSPRDAMLAAAVSPERRGEAFGFHRAMDHVGAVIGPLIAVCLLTFVTTDLRTIIWVAAVPGAAAIVVLLVSVREGAPAPRSVSHTRRWYTVLPDRRFLRFLVPLAIFSIANASDLFLLLNATRHDAAVTTLPLMWMGLHLVKAATSLYAGRLADRVGTVPMIVAGWVVYALVYFALAIVDAPAAIVALCIAYGAFHGLTEGSEKALVAELSPADKRGAFFGWYHLCVGVLALPASLIFGAIWEARGSSSAFAVSACAALVAVAALCYLRPRASAAASLDAS